MASSLTSSKELRFTTIFFRRLTLHNGAASARLLNIWISHVLEDLKAFKLQSLDNCGFASLLENDLGTAMESWEKMMTEIVDICDEGCDDGISRRPVGPFEDVLSKVTFAIKAAARVPGTAPPGYSSDQYKFAMCCSLVLTVIYDLQSQKYGEFRSVLGGNAMKKWTNFASEITSLGEKRSAPTAAFEREDSKRKKTHEGCAEAQDNSSTTIPPDDESAKPTQEDRSTPRQPVDQGSEQLAQTVAYLLRRDQERQEHIERLETEVSDLKTNHQTLKADFERLSLVNAANGIKIWTLENKEKNYLKRIQHLELRANNKSTQVNNVQQRADKKDNEVKEVQQATRGINTDLRRHNSDIYHLQTESVSNGRMVEDLQSRCNEIDRRARWDTTRFNGRH